MIFAHTGVSNLTVLARGPPHVTSLTSGLALTALEARGSEDSFYKIEVPARQELLNITSGGATADCDMYVKFGRRPGTSGSTFDYKSTSATSEESVTVFSPLKGKRLNFSRDIYT